ncbi:MAG TPA: efflux RND transporter periplasmic adaptor subunit [Woeseiaceae bacterium]|jgi:Cu(I)/Ag(I) efflux system membrane fusion protein|nr:efflux RND transporter periplasmic adaptor subunit [Woeseiaceae bacterium]
MSNYLKMTVALLAAIALGVLIDRAWQHGGDDVGGKSSSGDREILYWKAPMDPNYRRDEPGKSPMGMDLVPVYADEVGEEDSAVVSISPIVVNNLGVRTAAAKRGALSRRVETVGYVGYDEDTLQHIHTRVDGWIEKLAVKATGDPIMQGQLLFELYSPILVNAQEEYLAARNSGNARLLKASSKRLLALGVPASEIARLDRERTVDQLISVFAESTGYAAHLGVREGIYITPATEIMSIAQLDQVWVLAEVFERQAAWIEVGQQAEVEFDYLPGESWHGTVDYIYPELDQKSRTLKVRLWFDNKDQVLRPNMFARITIFGSDTTPVVHVPREALIRGGAFDRVVLALGDGRFRAQPVDIGIESADRVEIRSGVREGDLVVTSGQFLIDSESNIDSALDRMDEGPETALPDRVRIGAVVRGSDPGVPNVTLRHDPVPEWSWPSMTMSFVLDDASLGAGLEEGQSVSVVIQRQADGRHRIIEILPAEADHTGHEKPEPDEEPMDHSGHNMPAAEEEPMDHSGHNMPAAEEEPMDHSAHDMEGMQ